jgi:diguanylate cyclase (GGDEF)-like protein
MSAMVLRFIPPILLLLFAAAFVALRVSGRSVHCAQYFSSAFLAVGLGTFLQITGWPTDPRLNTLLFASLYVAGALTLAEGIFARSGKRLPLIFHAASSAIVLGLVWYFVYFDKNLIGRIYALNFGMGAILLVAAWQARFLLRQNGADRALFWLMLLLGLQFFPRTWLSTGSISIGDATAPFQSEFWTWAQFSVEVVGAAVGLGLLAICAADAISALERERDSDPLTGLLNRRGLQARAEFLARRKRARISVIVCDIDYFKTINDTLGHAAGDVVLSSFGRMLQNAVRTGDVAGRIGGEEFALVLKGSSVEQAFRLAERLRIEIAGATFDGLPPARSITCSFGIAEFHSGEDLWATIGRADRILYAAKKAGRNRTFAEGIQLPKVA